MKISPGFIEFEDYETFAEFVFDNNLVGVVQVSQPIKDNSGMILIKENVNIKESAIRKLESMKDQYKEYFRVRITNALATRLGDVMAHAMLPRLEKTDEQDLICHLYIVSDNDAVNYKNIVLNSFQNKFFTLAIYQIFLENRSFFYHIVDMGLLTMGILMQRPRHLRFLYRNALLAGIISDIVLSPTSVWGKPIPGEAQLQEISLLSAKIGENLGLPSEIIESVKNLMIPGIYSELDKESDYDLSEINSHPLLNDSFSEGESEDVKPERDKEQETNPEDYDAVVSLISEALKIARFIQQSTFKIPENKDLPEALITMLTFNVEKDIFDRSIAEPVITKFRKYEKIVKKVKKIAKIEKKCKFPPSAWAYPKPNATQILCQFKVADCPNFTRGWDINVVAPQQALGYIGTALMPDSYPKCKLEEELDKI